MNGQYIGKNSKFNSMRNIVLFLVVILLSSCGGNEIESCSDPVQKIVVLINKNPDDWSVKTRYDGDWRFTDLIHKSNVVVTMHHKKDYFDDWHKAEYKGWKITKPKVLNLTNKEIEMVNQAYENWDNHIINKTKCEISNILGDVEVTSDEMDFYQSETRNDFE